MIRPQGRDMTVPSGVTVWTYQGLHSLSGKTSYHQISWSLKAARMDVTMYNDRIALKFDRQLGSA